MNELYLKKIKLYEILGKMYKKNNGNMLDVIRVGIVFSDFPGRYVFDGVFSLNFDQ